MPADYFVVDPSSEMVWIGNGPYRRTFIATSQLNASPFLTMSVKTSYSTGAESASVLINGNEIGKVWPRPWLNRNYVDADDVTVIFAASLLVPSPPPFWPPWLPPPVPPVNTLEIIPVGQTYVFVGQVVFHSRV